MYHVVIALILFGVIAIYYKSNRESKFFKCSKIPHLPALPLVGNMGPVVFQQTSLVEHLTAFYNMNKEAKYIGLYNFSTPVIMIRDPELVKAITTKAFDHFTDHRGFIEPEQDPFFASSTFSLRGNEWRQMRSRLTSAFTSSKIKSMYSMTTKCAAIFGDHLVDMFMDKSGDVDVKDVFSKCTNDVIATCEYGCEVDSMKDPNNDFYVLGKNATDFDGPISTKFFFATSFPRIFKIFNIKMIEKNVADFFVCLVKETISVRREKNIRRPDVLQILMDTNESDGNEKVLSLDDMASQAFSFFFASFDTLSTMMCFGFYEIAKNGDVQRRLQAEVDEVLERTGGIPSYEDINALKYLEAVINETLRFHPAAAFIDRVCTKAFELPPATSDGEAVMIQPGQNIWIPMHPLQRDPNYYRHPEKFDPERFFGEAKNSIVPGTYIPFGYGPRICLGQRFALFEAKIVFFQLIARCEFSPSDKMKLPFKYSRRSFAILPEGGFWLKVRVRDSWKERNSGRSIMNTVE